MPKRLFPSLVFVAFAACVEEPTIPRLGDQPVQVTLTTSHSVLGPGEVLTITATITNTLSEEVTLVFPTLCEVRVFVRDDRGAIVAPDKGVHNCPEITTQLNINAGGTVVREFAWAGGAQLDGAPPLPRLPAGQYFISATLDAVGYSTIAFAVIVTLT